MNRIVVIRCMCIDAFRLIWSVAVVVAVVLEVLVIVTPE